MLGEKFLVRAQVRPGMENQRAAVAGGQTLPRGAFFGKPVSGNHYPQFLVHGPEVLVK